MNTLPLFFNLEKKSVLIIGGGDVAYRKASLVMQAGARVFVVAKAFDDVFYQLLPPEQIIQKSYDVNDLTLETFAFVIVATDDNKLNRQIHADAHAKNIAVNVVDTPDLCDFIFPAIVDRDPITVAVSSNGTAPVLSRLIRAKIETILPSNIGQVAKKAGQFRSIIKQKLPNVSSRRKFWENIFMNVLDEHANHGVKNFENQDLQKSLDEFLNTKADDSTDGEVYIVGAGAGSADLLTFKALRLMQQADVVLYDALVCQEIVDMCRRDSKKIFVGKKRSNHAKTQDEINDLLIFHAKQGHRVLRLKGGDPFIFGRGGEEMLACQKAGIPYQVVSGITSALVASAGAGIPLTHRGVATSVRFLTACHQSDDYAHTSSVYRKDETLVFYMGLHTLDGLVNHLIGSGLSAKTPIAIVAHAGREDEQVLTGRLDNIVSKQATAQLTAPAIIIVGEVVRLHKFYDARRHKFCDFYDRI